MFHKHKWRGEATEEAAMTGKEGVVVGEWWCGGLGGGEGRDRVAGCGGAHRGEGVWPILQRWAARRHEGGRLRLWRGGGA
ncbi:leucyl aminopeptidase [Sesbania bispinosa]|nr:leucyl aminopeptidase [Sesbania bispinosa]